MSFFNRRVRWRKEPPAPPTHSFAYEAVAVVALVVWNAFANLLVADSIVWASNLAVVAGLVWLAHRSGVDWDSLGLLPSSAGDGLRGGLVASAVIALVLVGVTAIPASREILADDRFVDVGRGEMVFETLLRIPLGTALAEEMAFRSVLLGVMLLSMSPLRAALVSSGLFGLWHILPGIDALETTAVLGFETAGESILAVAVQVGVTALAGFGLAWLRLRTGSVLAPIVAHTSLNSLAYLAGWLVVSNGWT